MADDRLRLKIGPLELGLPHLLGVIGALGLVAVLIVLAVMLPGRSADTVEERPAPLRYEWATADRLVLPDEYSQPEALEWVPYRPRREAWTDEQVAEFWLDPQEIGLDVLDERVEEHIRELLEEVP